MLQDVAFKAKLSAKKVRSVTREKIDIAWKMATEIVQNSEETGVRIMSVLDEDYPALLRELPTYPLFLFLKGNRSLLNKRGFVITGTPLPTDFGVLNAKKMAKDLVENNLTVISGLSDGIESAAENGVLESAVPENNIVILSGGIDQLYPPSSKAMAKRILEAGGLLVSEHPIGKRPDRYSAVVSNKIMIAMSSGVLVVESELTQELLITCKHANKGNKPLFVLKHPSEMMSLSVVKGLSEISENFCAKFVGDFEEIL